MPEIISPTKGQVIYSFSEIIDILENKLKKDENLMQDCRFEIDDVEWDTFSEQVIIYFL